METLKVEVGERERLARVTRPGNEPMPAVVMLHGAGGTAGIAVNQTGWDRKAAEAGFIAALPEGTARDPERPRSSGGIPRHGTTDRGGHVARAGVNDIAFIGALIGTLISRYGADPAAIFLTGFSNGASPAFRADADPLYPIDGGTVLTPWGGDETHPPARRSFERWSAAGGCGGEPSSRREASVGSRVARRTEASPATHRRAGRSRGRCHGADLEFLRSGERQGHGDVGVTAVTASAAGNGVIPS